MLKETDLNAHDCASSYEYSQGAQTNLDSMKYMQISKCISPKIANQFTDGLLDQIKNQIAMNKEKKETGRVMTNLFSKNKRQN